MKTMKKSLRLVLIGLALIMSFSLSVGAAAPNLTFTVAKVSEAPTIDGQINDATWVQASQLGSKTVVDQFHTADGISAEPRVAYMAYDDQAIYVAVLNYTPNPQGLVGTSSIWGNDGDAIYLQAPGQDFVHFGLDNTGQFVLEYGEVPEGAKSAVTKTEVQWISEMAIPFSTFGVTPKPGDTWKFNLTGHQAADGNVWVCMNSSYGKFANPDRFATLVFGE